MGMHFVEIVEPSGRGHLINAAEIVAVADRHGDDKPTIVLRNEEFIEFENPTYSKLCQQLAFLS